MVESGIPLKCLLPLLMSWIPAISYRHLSRCIFPGTASHHWRVSLPPRVNYGPGATRKCYSISNLSSVGHGSFLVCFVFVFGTRD